MAQTLGEPKLIWAIISLPPFWPKRAKISHSQNNQIYCIYIYIYIFKYRYISVSSYFYLYHVSMCFCFRGGPPRLLPRLRPSPGPSSSVALCPRRTRYHIAPNRATLLRNRKNTKKHLRDPYPHLIPCGQWKKSKIPFFWFLTYRCSQRLKASWKSLWNLWNKSLSGKILKEKSL